MARMIRSFPILPTTLALLFVLSATVAIQGRVRELAKDDEAVVVSMKDKKFDPAKLTIKVGQTVKWTNQDEHDHTVVADDGSFKSDNIGPGEDYSYTFKKAGKYPYACTYHPRMKGTITVEK